MRTTLHRPPVHDPVVEGKSPVRARVVDGENVGPDAEDGQDAARYRYANAELFGEVRDGTNRVARHERVLPEREADHSVHESEKSGKSQDVVLS